MSLYEGSPVFYLSRYHAASFLIPCPLDLLQVMGVDPWFEEFFILGVYRVRRFHFLLGDNFPHWRCALCCSRPYKDVIW